MPTFELDANLFAARERDAQPRAFALVEGQLDRLDGPDFAGTRWVALHRAVSIAAARTTLCRLCRHLLRCRGDKRKACAVGEVSRSDGGDQSMALAGTSSL